MPVTLSQNARKELDALLAAYPTSNDHPGTVVGVVNRQGEHLYLRAAGPSAAGDTKPMKSDAVCKPRDDVE